MKDNRIVRPEQLTEETAKPLMEGIASFGKEYLEKQNENKRKREEEKMAKLASGEWIEKGGKIYDSRYYKG